MPGLKTFHNEWLTTKSDESFLGDFGVAEIGADNLLNSKVNSSITLSFARFNLCVMALTFCFCEAENTVLLGDFIERFLCRYFYIHSLPLSVVLLC